MRRAKQLFSIVLSIIIIFSVLIPAIPVHAVESKNEFKDTKNHWTEKSINKIVSLGFMEGYNDHTFRPENKVTRVQLADMLYKMMNGYNNQSGSEPPVFKDIPPSYWGYNAVQGAVKEGIMTKKDYGDHFKPNQIVTRSEMAAIAARTLKLKPESSKYITFKDKKEILKDLDLISAIVKKGIINAYADKTFKPKKALSRGEAAVFLVRVYEDMNGIFFKDIGLHPAKESIQDLVSLGSISGYSDHTFRPDKTVTRADFIHYIVHTMGYKSEKDSLVFDDIPLSHPSYSVINSAVEQGILLPSDYSGKFYPNNAITRQEMAVFMARTLKLKPESTSILKFKDTKSITYKQNLVAATVKAKLVSSFKDNLFGPKLAVTRGQVSDSLMRLYTYSLNSSDPNVPTASPDRESKDEIKMNSNVKEISQQTLGLLESVTGSDSVFTFSGSPAGINTLKIGDVFTLPPSSKYPGGFAEKVVSISSQNGKTIIKTADPEFTEVFKELDIQEDKAVSFENLIPMEIPEGVTLKELDNKKNQLSKSALNANLSDGGFKLSLNELTFKVKDVDIIVNGDIDFKNTKLETDVDYSFNKLKTFETRFVSDPRLSVNVDAVKELASVEAGGTYTNSNIYKGIDFGATANIPSWMDKRESTGPIEWKKSVGKFYLPVYGPLGANFEAFLVVKADLSVGISLELIQDVHMDTGVKAKDGEVKFSPKKAEFEQPDIIIKGEGGAQLKAGPGVGIKLAIFKLSVGGLEGETGLKGEVYGHGSAGLIDKPEPGSQEHGAAAKFCFRSEFGAYAEVNATLDILTTLKIIDEATVTLLSKDKTFGEFSNCKDDMLAANPKFLILAPGESIEVDIGLYKYDKKNLELTKEQDKLKDRTLSHELIGDKIVSVTSKADKNGFKFTIMADAKAEPGNIGEVKFTYQEEKDSKKITDTLKAIIMEPEKIDANPSQITLKPGGQKQLAVQAIYHRPVDSLLDEIKKEGISINDFLKKDVTKAEGISYKSKNPSVVSVDSKGNLTANEEKEASAEIEISYKEKTDTVLVTVEKTPSSGGGGTNTGPSQLTPEQIKHIILEAEKKANETFLPEAESGHKQQFEAVQTKLKDYYSDNYLNNYWKKIYEVNINWFTDPHLLYPLTEAVAAGTEQSYTVNTQNSDLIKASVNVPLREDESKNDQFTYQYSLIKVNGKWLLDMIEGIGNERPQAIDE